LVLYVGLLWFAFTFEQGGRLECAAGGCIRDDSGLTLAFSHHLPRWTSERAPFTNLIYAFVAGYVLSKHPVITRGVETGIQTTVTVFDSHVSRLPGTTYVIRRHDLKTFSCFAELALTGALIASIAE
jgi:hypothetical protein